MAHYSRKAVKMATKSVDMLTTKLIKVEEILERVDPETVSDEKNRLKNQQPNSQ